MTTIELTQLTDAALIAETKRVADVERHAMAELLTLLIEVERRDLFSSLGYSSLFTYCTQSLELSEQAAYSRITAARAVKRVPAMLPMLADGALTLSSVGLLAPHLTDDNQDALLAAAQHQSTRNVQKMLASASPQPDITASIRATPKPATIAPLSARTYLLKVTIGEKAHGDLQKCRDLLRHAIPTGDPAAIVERALALLAESTERTKAATSARPRVDKRADRPAGNSPARARQRHIPAEIKRAVWKRDEGRCAFVGLEGRCRETAFLEFHHAVPFAAGGSASLDNIQLRCRSHNSHEARVYFGAEIGAEADARH